LDAPITPGKTGLVVVVDEVVGGGVDAATSGHELISTGEPGSNVLNTSTPVTQHIAKISARPSHGVC